MLFGTNVSYSLFPKVTYVGMCTTAHQSSDLATATYLNFSDYVGLPTLSVSKSGSNLNISWTPTGHGLYSSPAFGTGEAWTFVTSNNPATVPITGKAAFFRLQ